MSRVYVVAGQTEPISVQLLADARPVDLTGATTTLVVRDKTGTLVDTSAGVITILDAPLGKVRYSPPASFFDATLSPYVGHWRVVDTAARVMFWPNREADHWLVGLCPCPHADRPASGPGTGARAPTRARPGRVAR
jgi:hypothetical protein